MQVNGSEEYELPRKKSPAESAACMAFHWPTPGLKGRTFKLCVLNRWDFNSCVRSSPLRGPLSDVKSKSVYPQSNCRFFVTFVRLCPTSGSRLLPHACKTLGFWSSLAPIALCTQEQKSDKQTRWFSHWSLLIYMRIGTICCRQAFACLSTVSISLTSTATCKIQSANSRLFSCPVECFRDDLHKNRDTLSV